MALTALPQFEGIMSPPRRAVSNSFKTKQESHEERGGYYSGWTQNLLTGSRVAGQWQPL